MRTELTLNLPSLMYRHDVSDQLLNEFRAFVGEVTQQKYIFISRAESIVIEESAFPEGMLPPDIYLTYLKIEGLNAFVEVRNRTNFQHFGQVSDSTLNQVIMQSTNPVAVRGLHTKLSNVVNQNRMVVRTLFYRYPLIWYWATLILVWFGEYRLAKLFRNSLSLSAPLSALGAILIVAIGVGTTLVYANVALPFFTYWFPYFEIQGNLSRHRKSFQKLAGAVWTSLVAAGVLNLITLIRR